MEVRLSSVLNHIPSNKFIDWPKIWRIKSNVSLRYVVAGKPSLPSHITKVICYLGHSVRSKYYYITMFVFFLDVVFDLLCGIRGLRYLAIAQSLDDLTFQQNLIPQITQTPGLLMLRYQI